MAQALVPFARQMGLMQQQMFDQFQQSMMMMFQMFTDLHRDQMGAIREELDHLHDLTREIQALQAELLRRSQPPPPAPNGSSDGPAADGRPPASRVNGAGHAGPAAGAANPAAASASLPKSIAPPPGMSDDEVHAWLSQRILAIQQERQTRWQKVMTFLSGKRNERPTP
jgi:hypothetical protein